MKQVNVVVLKDFQSVYHGEVKKGAVKPMAKDAAEQMAKLGYVEIVEMETKPQPTAEVETKPEPTAKKATKKAKK